MINSKFDTSRRVIRSWPGQGTGETIYEDEDGRVYREITAAEAQQEEQATCGRVYHIRDGRVR